MFQVEKTKEARGKSSKTNLSTGIVNTDKNSLSASEICRILKACHSYGVASFEYQGITFNFHPRRNEDAEMPGPAADQTESIVEDIFGERDQAQLMDDSSSLEAEEAQLLIDDPFSFERSQIDRHIERARQHSGRAET